MKRRVITLLTDFGVADPYVGMMKGAILSLNADAALVDVTHEVPPQDVTAGAFLLERSARYFPEGTIHIAVVDPGVGTARRPVAARARGHFFVGPDNGVLARALRGARARAVELTEARYFRTDVSRTFHGRDLFAPVAAHLSLGVPLTRFGPPASGLTALKGASPRVRAGRVDGAVVWVDRFGNLITNLEAHHVAPRPLAIHVGAAVFRRLCRSYQDVAPGEPLAIIGSYGLLEIAARDGSAAQLLGLARGDQVRIIRA